MRAGGEQEADPHRHLSWVEHLPSSCQRAWVQQDSARAGPGWVAVPQGSQVRHLLLGLRPLPATAASKAEGLDVCVSLV